MPARTPHPSSTTPLAVVFAALVLYASLFPFTGWRWPPGQGFGTLLALPWPPWLDPFDLWANLLGYMPLGALVTWALWRRGLRTGSAMLLAVLLSAALSFGAEVAQNFLPGRHPSLKDLAMNSLGALLGAVLSGGVQGLGLGARWQGLRERWFTTRSSGALALLALWPVALLFPAPVPLALGQVGDRLREWLLEMLADVPWAEPAMDLLAVSPEGEPLRPLAEAIVTALGLLAPCLLAFAVARPGWRRVGLAIGALVITLLVMTLATLLNFGPDHALAWLTPSTLPALAAATLIAILMAPLGRRLVAGLALVALTALVAGVAQAPSDPYFAQSLQAWEQGRWIRFHGLAQWIGWLWPYAAMVWILSRLGSRD